MPDFRYGRDVARYRDTAGRFVSERTVRSWVDAVADGASDRMAALTERLVAGNVRLADWQRQMMTEVKLVNLANVMAARGGRDRMAKADFGYSGRVIRTQYDYLKAWAQSIQDGAAPLDRRTVARARLYGQHGRVAFEQMKAREDRRVGLDQERNRLGSAEHCTECPALSARGWVPAGTLPPIGQRACRANDRCSIERRKKTAEQAA